MRYPWLANVSLCCYLDHSIMRRPQPQLIPTEFSPGFTVTYDPAPRLSPKDPSGKAAEMLLATDSLFNTGHRALISSRTQRWQILISKHFPWTLFCVSFTILEQLPFFLSVCLSNSSERTLKLPVIAAMPMLCSHVEQEYFPMRTALLGLKQCKVCSHSLNMPLTFIALN